MTQDLIARLTKASELASPGKWFVDEDAHRIWVKDPFKGNHPLFDVRGWGYLTGHGHGALGLPTNVAEQIQRANAEIASIGPKDLLEILKLARAALQATGIK